MNTTQTGRYLYCIIETRERKKFSPVGMGDHHRELVTITYKDLGAVVSSSPIIQYPVTRENTLVHQKAIEGVMQGHTVLPVRFSTIAETEEQIIRVLQKRGEEFKGLLGWLKDKIEVGVNARWTDMEPVFKEILMENGEIRKMKEQIAARPEAPSYLGRIELGRWVEEAMKRKKEEVKERILNALRNKACEYKVTEAYGDQIILKSAFLVEKKWEKEFESAVDQLQDEQGKAIQFRYISGVPPFNFVNLVIKWDEE